MIKRNIAFILLLVGMAFVCRAEEGQHGRQRIQEQQQFNSDSDQHGVLGAGGAGPRFS